MYQLKAYEKLNNVCVIIPDMDHYSQFSIEQSREDIESKGSK